MNHTWYSWVHWYPNSVSAHLTPSLFVVGLADLAAATHLFSLNSISSLSHQTPDRAPIFLRLSQTNPGRGMGPAAHQRSLVGPDIENVSISNYFAVSIVGGTCCSSGCFTLRNMMFSRLKLSLYTQYIHVIALREVEKKKLHSFDTNTAINDPKMNPNILVKKNGYSSIIWKRYKRDSRWMNTVHPTKWKCFLCPWIKKHVRCWDGSWVVSIY